MQRRYAALVDSIGIRPRLNKADNRGCLRGRIPAARTRTPDSGRMQRLGATPVPRVNVRSRSYEPADYLGLIRRRGDVQCSVACVNDATDRIEEESLRALTSRPDVERCGRQKRRRNQHPGHGFGIAGDNGVHQFPEGQIGLDHPGAARLVLVRGVLRLRILKYDIHHALVFIDIERIAESLVVFGDDLDKDLAFGNRRDFRHAFLSAF